MPSLGFLKKKRTRDGNPDPAASQSKPTPANPAKTSSGSSHHQQHQLESFPTPRTFPSQTAGSAHHSHSKSNSNSTASQSPNYSYSSSNYNLSSNYNSSSINSSSWGSSNSHPGRFSNNDTGSKTTGAPPPQQQTSSNPSNYSSNPLQSQSQSQSHSPQSQSQSSYTTNASSSSHARASNNTSASGDHRSQFFPSINSLVHKPQHDVSPNSANLPHSDKDASTSKNTNTLGFHLDPPPFAGAALRPPGITPPASASPGTDPTRLQLQQQQAYPTPPPPNNAPSASSVAKPPPTSSPTMQQHQQSQQPLQQSDQLQNSHYQGQAGGVPGQPSPLGQPQIQQPPPQAANSTQQAQPVSQPRVTKGKYSLNDFDIQRTLGTGSFGRVHLVQSKHNQRFYAVKVLKKAQVVKMKQVEHTNDERRMLSDVKHPFLITLWGTFQDWKNLYMVMDFVEGGELFSLLRKSGRFPNPVAKFYAAEVTLALEYLHSKNIIYRDLKPENLLLDRHGHLKITDFGFAKRVPDQTWTLCGTPDYLAPEVVSNKGYTKSVDWWSLGILIYEMLCGYTPFWDGGSPMKIYENITKGVVKYPGYINHDAQNLLERLITADLTKRLGNLYGGSDEVKNHPWFAEVTWDRLARKDIDAPYTPPVKAGTGDASQFDRYPEDPDKYGLQGGADEYGHLFAEF